jgi:AcrR family transcriptional regulator
VTALGDDVRPRPGRRRDPACDEAILKATIDAFVEEGYAGVSIEGVAARAGVGKATIYRRFASKAELVVEAVRATALIDDHLVNTGDLRADLISAWSPMVERLRGPDGKLLLAFAAERVGNPDLAAAFERSVIGAKRVHVRKLLDEAVERGELAADADLELIAESGPAIIWHHALYGLPLDDDLPSRILDLALPT